MLRNLGSLNIYLNRLIGDIYPQPPDIGHTTLAMNVFDNWITRLEGVKSVVDMGCGDTAFMKLPFESIGVSYTGVAINTKNPEILNLDFTFTPFDDNQFDLVFARHSLEHSAMPIITLMEWRRISKTFLCVVNPNPNHYGYVGQNHYSVCSAEVLEFWLSLAGWDIIWRDSSEPTELRYMCQKRGI